MSYLTLDEALKLKNRNFEDIELPELGGKIRLAELAAGKSLEFKQLQEKREKGGDQIERKQMIVLLTGAVVDGDGKPMLNEKTAGQLIDAVSFKTLQLIVTKVLEMMTPSAPPKDPASEGTPAGN